MTNRVEYAQWVEQTNGMFLEACNKHLPAVHVDAELDRIAMMLFITPWSWQRIMADGCRPFVTGTYSAV